MHANKAIALLRRAAYREAILRDKPAGYWSLDETSGDFIDLSPGGNDGTSTGTISRDESGAVASGKSVLFGGTGGIDTTLSSGVAKGALTMEGWIKFSGNPGLVSVFGFRQGNFGTFLALLDGPNLFARYSFYADIVAPVTAGAWHHVAQVHTGTAQYLYLNGVQVGTPGAHSGAVFWDSPGIEFAIGYPGTTVGLTQVFPGYLDEVATYDYALTAEQITNHYVAGLRGV